jgi:hypothetical protein
MEKMSTTKRLLVKAVKPQDQTSVCKPLGIIEATLDEKITELSKAIDSAVMDSMVYGSAVLKMEGGPVSIGGFTATTTPYHGPSIAHIRNGASNPSAPYLRPTDLKREMLDTHPAFELNTEQLRAAWMLTYGNRWVDIAAAQQEDYMSVVALRLKALGELEVHNLVDQYNQVGRLKA